MRLMHHRHEVNDTDPPAQTLPANIAVPWHSVATRLGHPPILSYAAHQFHNWAASTRRAPSRSETSPAFRTFSAAWPRDRMPERCDPYVYYHRVRRFVSGTKNNPAPVSRTRSTPSPSAPTGSWPSFREPR